MNDYGSLRVLEGQLKVMKTMTRQNKEYSEFISKQNSSISYEENKIKELRGNLLKNLFQKGKVEIEINKHKETIKSKKQSINNFQELYDENVKHMDKYTNEINECTLSLPEQYMNVEIVSLLADIGEKLYDDLQRSPTLEEIYEVFETEHPSKVNAEREIRHSYIDAEQSMFVEEETYSEREMDTSVVDERKRWEQIKEETLKEYQAQQANFADNARRFGEDRDTVRHLDDLAGRSVQEREEADRQCHYRENEDDWLADYERGGIRK